MDDLPFNESPELKPSIKLPKTDTQWKEANMFFRSELHTGDINDYNLTKTVEIMNSVIYIQFAETYRTVKNKNDYKGIHGKYKDFIKYELKKELHNLKNYGNSEMYLIKDVSKLLHNVINKKNNNIIYTSDHDKEIKENFWVFAKLVLEEDD